MTRIWIVALAALTAVGCDPPGRPSPNSQAIAPSQVMDFDVLFKTNCAGCHGPEGKGGVAIAIGDPNFLAVTDDATIRHVVTNGFPGTLMPVFGQSAGGILTSAQVEVIVAGIRSHWEKPGSVRSEKPPAHAAQNPGDPVRGASVYSVYCVSCHGAEGRGGLRAGSIVDPAYLSLVSDQYLRTTIIIGRADLGEPDWRTKVPGKPMSDQDVTDVVAWLAAHRLQRSDTALSSVHSLAGEIR